MLIGAEFYGELMADGQRVSSTDPPTLQNTVFGWVVIGNVKSIEVTQYVCNSNTLDNDVQKLWEIDVVSVPSNILSPNERNCESLFTDSVFSLLRAKI